jgi:hypothetical protein
MNMPFNLMQIYQQFKSNPIGFLAQRYNIPQGISAPQDIIQHLLNSGQVSQAQVNRAMQMRNDPQFRNMFQ